MALPDLGVTHALLLQGPAGPFMRRFAAELTDHGVRVTKINFHAGDVLFFPGPDAVPYRGSRLDWPSFVEQLMIERGIDGIFCFGDCRSLHRDAIEIAQRRGIAVFAWEEGYLRPEWITLERHGVNGHSQMPKDPEYFRALELDAPRDAESIGPHFHLMAWYSTCNALAFTLLNQGFPQYEHHRNLNAWYHTFIWVRNVVRKKQYEMRERGMLERFTGELSQRYFLVPLQVWNDFQLSHSPYDDLMVFIEEVAESFVAHASADDHIVFKHHPMARAYQDYTQYFKDLSARHGLEGRLHYCHDQNLPEMLDHTKGVVTINSTVGLQAIFHDAPVITMGDAIYDMPGLTFQGSLEEFFHERPAIDQTLYAKFRRYLLRVNQVNGSFYKPVAGAEGKSGVIWFDPPTPEELRRGGAG